MNTWVFWVKNIQIKTRDKTSPRESEQSKKRVKRQSNQNADWPLLIKSEGVINFISLPPNIPNTNVFTSRLTTNISRGGRESHYDEDEMAEDLQNDVTLLLSLGKDIKVRERENNKMNPPIIT